MHLQIQLLYCRKKYIKTFYYHLYIFEHMKIKSYPHQHFLFLLPLNQQTGFLYKHFFLLIHLWWFKVVCKEAANAACPSLGQPMTQRIHFNEKYYQQYVQYYIHIL